MKNSLKYSNLWLPFVYSIAMSGIALHGANQGTIPMPVGLTPFIAFLPMAFFLSALSILNHISKLEKRIASLEKQAGLGTHEITN
jgi:hypothetical protein